MLFSRLVVECTLVALSLVLSRLLFVNANEEETTEEPTREPNPEEGTSSLLKATSFPFILPSPSFSIFLNPISSKSGLSLSNKVAIMISSDSRVAVLKTGKTPASTLSGVVLKHSSIAPNSDHSSLAAIASKTAQVASSPSSDFISSSVDALKSHHSLPSVLSSTVKSASLAATEFHPSQTSILLTQRQSEISSSVPKRSTSVWVSSQALVQESISFVMSSKSESEEGRVVSSSVTLNLHSLSLKPSSTRGTTMAHSLSNIIGQTAVGTSIAVATFTMSSIQSTGVHSISLKVDSTRMTYLNASATVSSSSLLIPTTPSSALYPQSTLLSSPWQPSSYVQSLPPTTPPPPDPPILAEAKALSANVVYIMWNVSIGQTVDNFTVELSLDSVTWKQATCKYSLLEGKCVVAQREARMSELQPYTNFTFRVFAVNQFGVSKASKESVWVITNETEPSKPQNISTQSLNSQEICVMWAEPLHPNGRIRYRLSYHVSSEPNSTAQVVFDGNSMKFLVTDLKPFTRYTFIVVAYNVKHNYSSQAVVAIGTTDSAEPSPPRNITAKSVNSTAVKVTWLKSLHPNGVILYRLYVRLSKGEQSANRLVHNGVNTMFVVSRLQEFTEYTFAVESFNVKYNWTSTPAVATETTHPAAPSGSPQNVQATTNSSSAIIVQWSPPLESEQNGVITGYDLLITSLSGPNSSEKTGYNATLLVVTDLQAFTNYSFAVRAENNVGVGPFSGSVSNVTFEAEPSPPRNITAKSVNSTAVKVTWLKSLHPNGVIRYRLNVRLSKDEQSANRLIYYGVNTMFVVSRLQEFTEYTFTVESFNVKYNWTSTPAVATETTHPAAPSGSPQNVQATTNSSSAIIVQWSPPLESEQNGVITGYDLLITSLSGPNSSEKTGYNATLLVVTDLQAFTNYSFAVRAENNVGVGPFSGSVSNVTFEAEPSPPRNITAKSVNSTAVKVTWLKSLHPNGVIRYRLNVRLSKDEQSANRLIYYGVNTMFVVSRLQEFTEYTFTVESFNVKYNWTSTPAVATETTHPAEPSGTPQNVRALTLSSTSILVTWDPPLESEQNGVIVKYTVHYTSQASGETKNLNTTGNETSLELKNLSVYTNYSFAVKAWNMIGNGPNSELVMNTTLEGLPGAPNITNVESASSSLAITWRAPSEANGVLTAFTLCWSLEKSNNRSCTSLRIDDTVYSITKLKPYTRYNVSLSALTSVGSGPPFSGIYQTDEGVPSAPLNVRAWNTSESSIFVSWVEPTEINGVLLEYKVYYIETEGGAVSDEEAVVNTSISLTNLKPYTRYNISVQAFTGKGGGGKSSQFSVETDETVPSAVSDVCFRHIKKTAVEVVWKSPVTPNGKIGYRLLYWRISVPDTVIESFFLPGSDTSKLVEGLKPYVNYTFSVIPYNLRKMLMGPSFNKSVTTKPAAPDGPPINIKITNTSSTSITLTWDPPREPNGKIQEYMVRYYGKDPDKKYVHGKVKKRLFTLSDLKPWTNYNLSVACKSTGGIGQYSDWISQQTDEGAPPPIGTLAPPNDAEVKSNTFEVVLSKASNDNGKVSYYQVIVRELAKDDTGGPVMPDEPDRYKTNDLHTYDQARRKKPTLVPYIAFQFDVAEFDKYKRFTVGNREESRDLTVNSFVRRSRRADGRSVYYNGPLEEETFYTVFLRAYVNKDAYTSSPWIEPVETSAADHSPKTHSGGYSSTKVGLIVGLVITLLVFLILVLVGVVYIRKKRLDLFGAPLDDREDYSNGEPMKLKARRKRRSLQKRLMGSTDSLEGLEELSNSRARRQPVPIDDFERHVDRMHMDGDHGFSEEYTLVQPEEEFSFQQFLNPANKYKNRYANIVAYDHTRVILSTIEGMPGSDYINANFIDGYNRPRAYIAAQGPLMETFDDFWRMVWEQRSLVIVMLTKLEERGRKKCDKYWPDRGAKTYGQVQVTLKQTLNMSYYTVRKMTISHKQIPDEERNIKQFHFTVWPDHGVPSHPTPLLSLVRHVSTSNRDAYGPMVVHCSAGVGRTGTFITLDVMLQKISEEDCVDVFGFVHQMRFHRNYMVQTEAQYVFIHDALLEAISCGVTEMEAKDLSTRLRELRQVDPETGYTYLENEFCRLAKEENHPIAFKSASLTCNAMKNRYANILPFESTRVHLKMRPGEMGSDYINANYIDGYCQPKAYIATQAPVPDTFEDFWRLIWEHDSAAIVMLTMQEERGKVKCHRYWPSDGSQLYGVILVEMIEEETCNDCITRKFKLTHTEEKDTRTIRQFQYTDWPDSGFPDYGVGIIDLIGQVQKWQQQSGNTAIVIHCSGGVGRTGVFCAVSIMIERLKAEGVIDVFQTVQAMRLQRPAMVQTADQYEFCYTTLQEYLDSFDLYANFQ